MQLAFRLFTNPRKGFNRNTILLCIETATVVSGLVVYVAKFIGSYDINIASHLLLWLYLAAIVSIRVIDRPVNEPQIILSRYHTAFLYGWLWLLAAVLFRSALIHPVSSDDRSLPIFNFACFSLLFIVALNTGSNYHPKPYTPGDPAPSRELGASIAALFTFSWVDPIVWKAYKHVYELDDIWDLPPKDGAEAVNTTYNRTTAPGGLAWQLLSFVWRDLILQLCWAIIQALNSFIPVMLFRAVLQYIESPTDVSKHLISLYVLLILASGILSAVASGQTQWLGKKMCIRLRSILMSRIYLKALKRPLTMPLVQTEGNVPPSDRKRLEETHTSSGAVINMMSTDSSKVSEVTSVLHTAFAEAPIKIAVSTALLFIILGWSAIATLLSILLSLPISLSISKQLGRYQKLISMATDARIHDTTEAMNNIRTIKYFVWEDRFLARIDKHRKDELVNLRKRFTIWALAASAWSGIPMIIIALSFLTYTLIEKKTLVASVAFTALSLFGMLRAPLDQIISLIAQLQEVKVSIGRIERFLDELDTDKYSQLSDSTADELDSHLLGFERATFA
ncbi:hypothetical protein M433DRAFT_8533 [Acidomyces richmondensis BFW]|nr:hypothetical protein M433DRAFT_8533 [Acidomyces richmondensis BFW]